MKYNKNEIIGRMRDRITIQNVTRSKSDTGYASESWADLSTVWANAESKLPPSNETVIDGKNTAKNISDFTIRYTTGIDEESRIIWNEKLYQVRNIKVSHDRRFISFQGEFYDSYIITGVNVASSVNGIATTSANLKLIMSVIGQANAIASSFADLTVFQQGTVVVAASVNVLGNVTANLTKVININSSVDATANVSAPLTISKNIASSVNATATTTGGLQIGKLLSASVISNATAISILDVVTQGIVLVNASVTATGTSTANVKRIITLASSPTTAAETNAIAILTKVLEASATASAQTNAAAQIVRIISASATATAQTSANAQITIPVNALATAMAQTSANAQITIPVNASATATAQTSASAQIVRIISASATAMAQSSAEASFGVTFVASVNATALVSNASIARTATLNSSLTANGTTTATLESNPSIDADATAFILRVTTAGGSLTTTEQTAIRTLVADLKSNNIWTKMKAIYPMVGASAAACAQNLKSSSFTGQFGGAITYSANGITSNGITGYLDTGFNPSLHNSANSSHLSYYSRTSVTESKVDIGCYGAGYTNPNQLAIHYNGGSSYYNPNNTTDSSVQINEGSSQGLFIASRTSSSNIFGKRNNNNATTNTNTEARNNVKIFILAASINNSAEFFNTKQCAFASIGDGLNTTDASNLYTIVQTFQTSLSRQV